MDGPLPLVPAKAGTQSNKLKHRVLWPRDSRLRGNERSVWERFSKIATKDTR